MGYHRHCNRCNPINRLNEYIYYHNRLNRRIVRFKRSWDEIYKIINDVMRNKNGFSRCAEFYIGRLRKEGRHSTAHVYKNALFSFSKFCGTLNVSFRQVTRESLRRYGQYLYECGLKPNTISTYMRMLRSIYNRGVEAGIASYVPRLFHDVYTGVDIRQKKALPAVELHKLLYEDPKSERLRRTQAIVPVLWNVVCRFGSFGEIGFGSECVAV